MQTGNVQREERCDVTVRERILAIRLSENIKHQPDFARKIGVDVSFSEKRQNTSPPKTTRDSRSI